MGRLSYDDAVFSILKNIIVTHANKSGFTKTENGVIDDLTNIVCSYIMSVGLCSKQFCELSGRSTINSFDLFASLNENGFSVDKLETFVISVPSFPPLPVPEIVSLPPDPIHKIGDERPMPQHIPSFLPKFPNPHTYVNTKITIDYEISYAKARELQAQNRRNAENSLYRYALSTYDSYCLFRDLYEKTKEKAKSELEKQEAELRAKRARYSDTDNISDMFENKETMNSLVRRAIPDAFFVLKPFVVSNPTMLALCDDQEDETEHNQPMENRRHEDSKLKISIDEHPPSPESTFSDDV